MILRRSRSLEPPLAGAAVPSETGSAAGAAAAAICLVLVVAKRWLVRAASCSWAIRCCSGSGVPPASACRRRRAGVDDRPAEIAGQRRAELRRVPRQAGVVSRQVGEPVRRRAIVGVVEFGAGGLAIAAARRRTARRRSRPRRRAPRPISTLRESRVTRGRSGRSRISCGDPRAAVRTRSLVLRCVGHDCGLPSVRTMRTFFWGSPPSRSSAAANSRSTIMWLPLDAVVHELGAALRADDPERRHLALADAARELDEHLPPVVEGAQRPPGRIVAFDPVAEIERVDVRRRSRPGAAASAAAFWRAQRDELVLRIGPGDRRHVGLLGRAQLEMIGAPVGVDDEIGDEVRPRRLDQDVDALGRRPSRSRCRR